MIAKVNDRNVTAEIVQAMTPKELKAFENRLRALAFKQGFKFGKFVHPFLGPTFTISGATASKGALTILELRDHLYGLSK